MTGKVGNWLDNFGILASWTCAAHCLLMPIIVGIVPLLGLNFLVSETAERLLIGVSILVALFSFLPAYIHQHRKLHSILLATTGLSFIVFTHLLFEENLIPKMIFILAGALFVTAAHLLNRHFCKTCKVC